MLSIQKERRQHGSNCQCNCQQERTQTTPSSTTTTVAHGRALGGINDAARIQDTIGIFVKGSLAVRTTRYPGLDLETVDTGRFGRTGGGAAVLIFNVIFIVHWAMMRLLNFVIYV